MTKQTPKKRGRGRPRLDASDGREDIKRAALTEFARHGFKGASIDQIAEAAGVAKRLIHYHFGSKDELWTQAVSEAFELFRLEAIKFGTEVSQKTLEEAIGAFAHAIVHFAAERTYLVQIAIDETRQGGERAQWLSETYLIPLHKIMLAVLNTISASETDQRIFASHVIPSIFGAINFSFIDADVVSKAYAVDVFDEAYVNEQADFIAMLLRACIEEDRRRVKQL